jgi:F-type H+-transporting ATPase subunit alpha
MNVTDEVLIIYAGTKGHLDHVPVPQVAAWEREFLTFMHDQKPEVRKVLTERKSMDDDIVEMIEAAIKDFQGQWNAKGAKA